MLDGLGSTSGICYLFLRQAGSPPYLDRSVPKHLYRPRSPTNSFGAYASLTLVLLQSMALDFAGRRQLPTIKALTLTYASKRLPSLDTNKMKTSTPDGVLVVMSADNTAAPHLLSLRDRYGSTDNREPTTYRRGPMAQPPPLYIHTGRTRRIIHHTEPRINLAGSSL